MADNKIIEVNGLSATFGEREVLRNVSFSAYQGEVTVILGESGSGKTTVLKQLLGLYEIQEGYVSILDNNINDLNEDGQKDL